MKRINNATVIFNRDVEATELAEMFKGNFDGDIIINGTLMIDEPFEITCDNLFADSIDSYAFCDIEVKGNLYVREYACFCNCKVNGSIYSGGNINSHRFIIAEEVYTVGDIQNGAHQICIGGSLYRI